MASSESSVFGVSVDVEGSSLSFSSSTSGGGSGGGVCAGSKDRLAVDVPRERYPFCLVWTPIPGLTALLPFVGHLGMADSRGVIHDFAGPYYISVDQLSFGATARYIQLVDEAMLTSKPNFAQDWDEAVRAANEEYSKRMHNLCCDNCHSHVAMALNLVQFKGFTQWNMVVLAAWVFFTGHFASFWRGVWAFLPSVLLYGIIYAILHSSS